MGVYTKPSRLRLATTLIFPEQEMALAFWEGLRKTGKPRSLFRICGRRSQCADEFFGGTRIDSGNLQKRGASLEQAAVQRI